jgi:hypothetical protein
VERSERSDERRLEDLDPSPNQLTVRETERRREDFWRILLDGEKPGPACRCCRDSLVVGIKRPVTPGCRYWGSAKQCIIAPEFTGPSESLETSQPGWPCRMQHSARRWGAEVPLLEVQSRWDLSAEKRASCRGHSHNRKPGTRQGGSLTG